VDFMVGGGRWVAVNEDVLEERQDATLAVKNNRRD
jgi:hypothetical protein